MTTFTADVRQYLMPDGRLREVTTELPATLREAYMAMQQSGCRLEAEVLTTGEVSVTIFDPKEEVDVDIEVVPNGPRVQTAIAAMLNRNRWLPAAVDAVEQEGV